ncbi:rhodanese-like domain-containing protein [Burkholderiaceae bacterium DAT-1]|nr:rhodanese-like domain-containing protein [Burkholderiaceae bacterium DAT-1]
MHIKRSLSLALIGATLSGLVSTAYAADAPATQSAQAEQPWKYQAKRLSREEVDTLLAKPSQVLVLDVRRPDELIKYGSFPVFLNIQFKDIDKHLAWLPRDKQIVTVSNHAQRAGAVADALAAKGYLVAGAAGSEDYEKAGGTQVAHIVAPPPRTAGGAAAPAAPAPEVKKEW